jgi:hypothetical protein
MDGRHHEDCGLCIHEGGVGQEFIYLFIFILIPKPFQALVVVSNKQYRLLRINTRMKFYKKNFQNKKKEVKCIQMARMV